MVRQALDLEIRLPDVCLYICATESSMVQTARAVSAISSLLLVKEAETKSSVARPCLLNRLVLLIMI